MSQLPKQVHTTLPIAMAPVSSSTQLLQAQLGSGLGNLVQIEASAAGTLYTVPIGKTFNGVARLAGSGTGSITLTAATGGTLAVLTFDAKGTGAEDTCPISVAGGGGGNVISVTATAGITSVAIIGYVS